MSHAETLTPPLPERFAASPIAETARLETAAETLAEYIGYLSVEIDVEQ